jgi:hypothetical protein
MIQEQANNNASANPSQQDLNNKRMLFFQKQQQQNNAQKLPVNSSDASHKIQPNSMVFKASVFFKVNFCSKIK